MKRDGIDASSVDKPRPINDGVDTPQPGDQWHLDAGFLTLKEPRHDLWRAVDQNGHVLEMLGQRRREKTAAQPCFRTRLKGVRDVPRVIVTEKLASDGAAKQELMPSVEHRQHRDATIPDLARHHRLDYGRIRDD